MMVGFVLDPSLDVSTRMTAAGIALPYLFPKLSASTVDSRSTVVNVDAAAVMDRLTERLARLALPEEPVTLDAVPEVVLVADDDGEDGARIKSCRGTALAAPHKRRTLYIRRNRMAPQRCRRH